MTPKEHLTTKFQQELLQDLSVELKEMQLVGVDVHNYDEYGSMVFRVSNLLGDKKYFANLGVRRNGELLCWYVIYGAHGRMTAWEDHKERNGFQQAWKLAKCWVQHGKIWVPERKDVDGV